MPEIVETKVPELASTETFEQSSKRPRVAGDVVGDVVGAGVVDVAVSTVNKSLPLLKVKKLSEHATIPTRGSILSAGYDLSAAYDMEIPARGKGIAKTDLSIALPEGTYGRVAPRSGLAWKKHIDVGAGVIDADYRGNVGVVLFNHAEEAFEIKKGDRVAQLILESYISADVAEVEELDETERGAGGFGSTGVSK